MGSSPTTTLEGEEVGKFVTLWNPESGTWRRDLGYNPTK